MYVCMYLWYVGMYVSVCMSIFKEIVIIGKFSSTRRATEKLQLLSASHSTAPSAIWARTNQRGSGSTPDFGIRRWWKITHAYLTLVSNRRGRCSFLEKSPSIRTSRTTWLMRTLSPTPIFWSNSLRRRCPCGSSWCQSSPVSSSSF